MRLRNYFFALFAASFGLLVLLFATRTDSILGGGFEELRNSELHRVREQIKAVVKSKQERVEQIVWVAEQAPKLDLDALKRQAKVQVAEYFVPGKYPSDSEIPWSDLENSAKTDSVTYWVLNHKNYPSLIGFIKNRGKVLVIGFHFDEYLERRVHEINNSKVKFYAIPVSEVEKRPNTFSLYEAGNNTMAAEIVPDPTFANQLRSKLLHGLLLIGLLCFGLFAGILYLFLERGFLVGFRSLLEKSRKSVLDLEQGKAPVIEKTRHFMAENNTLATNLHTFAQAIEKYREVETQAARVRLAEQVAHDLRSPVSALEMLLNSLDDMDSDNFQAMSGCLNRIKSMAQSILTKKNSTTSPQTVKLPAVSLDSILSGIFEEKKVQYKDLPVTLKLSLPKRPVFAEIREDEIKRGISNLIDNAVEAITDKGDVTVSLQGSNTSAVVTVKDNGRGIPADLIPKVGMRGFSAGKPGGSGLGLNFAMAVVADHRGSLSIESEEKKGTTIRFELPSIAAPAWFFPSVDLTRYSHIVVTDDDSSVHLAWDLKLADFGLKIVHLYSPQELETWISSHQRLVSRTFFLCDYEFSENERNGLDAIVQFKLQGQSALVTGRANDTEVQNACLLHSARLVPKHNLLHFKLVKRNAHKATRRKTA